MIYSLTRAQGARVTFALGRGGPGLERLRLRRGDSVVLSASDPLSDAVGEGTLVGLSDLTLTLTLALTLTLTYQPSP